MSRSRSAFRDPHSPSCRRRPRPRDPPRAPAEPGHLAVGLRDSDPDRVHRLGRSRREGWDGDPDRSRQGVRRHRRARIHRRSADKRQRLDHGRRPAQAVACYDGAGPRYMGQTSARFGTPVGINLLGAVATALFIMATEITSGNAAKYFTVVLGLAISTTTISYLAISPRCGSRPELFPRPAPLQGSGRERGHDRRDRAHVRLCSARDAGAPLARVWRVRSEFTAAERIHSDVV